MNNKLIIGVLIVLIFVLIIFVPLYLKKRENFTIYEYPDPLIAEHVNFINSKSNEYSNIFHIFDEIANQVFLLYKEDETKLITIKNINTSIYEIVHERFLGIYNTINCSDNTQNEECKLLKIVLQFFDNIDSDYIDNIPGLTLPTTLEMSLTNDTDIENKIHFKSIKKELDELYKKAIVSNVNSFTKIRKELIIKKLVKNILFSIHFTIYPSSVGGLACPIYTADTCPSIPYKQETGTNSPTLPASLIEKYKCAIDKSFPPGKDNLCVNSENNKYVTTKCEVMNGYGKLMCENTNFRDENGTLFPCKYENLTQKCVNPNISDINYLNTTIDSEGNYAKKDGFPGKKCHLIYNNDLEQMEKACNSQSDSGCRYYEKEDSKGEKHGFCIAENEADRPPNFCLELSNVDSQFAEDMNCRVVNKNNGEYFYSVATSDLSLSDEEAKLKCHLFDSSYEKVESGFTSTQDKQEEDMGFVKGADNQRLLCEGLKTGLGDKKCQYVEYNKYIPTNHKSKYAKLGMCIPKDSINVEAELIKDKGSCKDNLYWSENNGICLNVDGKCDSFKHKNVCNLYKHCLWQQSDDKADGNEYEYGYCRDLSSSLNRVEDLIDTIHQKHLENAVELKGIEDSVSKLVPKFKNVLTKN